MVDQEMYLQAAIGQPKFYRTCPGLFLCGNVPYESKADAPGRPDLERARSLMKESGYDGKPVVVLDPTDRPELHGAALVTRELLTKIGVNVDLQAVDWSTLVSRRAKKDPPSAGGWNIFCTNWVSSDALTPAVNAGIAGGGEKGWFGWSSSAELEKLRMDWIHTADPAKRKQLPSTSRSSPSTRCRTSPRGSMCNPRSTERPCGACSSFQRRSCGTCGWKDRPSERGSVRSAMPDYFDTLLGRGTAACRPRADRRTRDGGR